MSAFYDELEQIARELIAEFGFEAHLVRAGTPTGPAHDPRPGAPSRLAIQIVDTGQSITKRDNTQVQTGDVLGIISTAGAAPLPSDRIEISGKEYALVFLAPVRPGGQSLLFEFQARR